MSNSNFMYLDTLYGSVKFEEPIASLINSPVVQRLRHVRLSNIDSIAMPGIANLSRYEHVLGTCYISQQMGFYSKLEKFDQIAFSAAALLHDWAITAFGHLVEEAFKYLDLGFDHQEKLHEIIANNKQVEVGGIALQILGGRQNNLQSWAQKAVGINKAEELLLTITKFVQGKDKLGHLISGEMDIDNIDNVCRMAYHMGLEVDKNLPLRLTKAIIAFKDSGEPIFERSAEPDIGAWLEMRKSVYTHLMPAEPDFSQKLMILFATVKALQAGEIRIADWNLTDSDFLLRLRDSKDPEVRDIFNRWLCGEFWDTSPLYWVAGQRPSFPSLLAFSDELSAKLKRHCFVYGIKDKRERRLKLYYSDASYQEIGSSPKSWLFGIGSSKRQSFTQKEVNLSLDLAADYFKTRVIGLTAPTHEDDVLEQACLL